MPTIEMNNDTMPGGLTLPFAGAPSAGTDQVDTITVGGTPTSGDKFYLVIGGFRTADIAWSATTNTLVANIDAAVEALPVVGTGGVTTANSTLSSGVGDVTLTWTGGNLTKLALPGFISSGAFTGASTGTIAIASPSTTPGVTATYRGQGKGVVVRDTTNGVLYINTGTALAPTWTKVGTQS